ncbi:MAG: hypothetical protein EXR72_24585 [Myxococcales bacterium]|nr:hypothetical protein [Myxococcales bacterium]
MRLSEKQRWFAALVVPVLVGGMVAACASFPERFPASSAASPEAPEAARANVTASLGSDPPLPGEPVGASRGLERGPDAPAATPDAGTATEHGGHHHGH